MYTIVIWSVYRWYSWRRAWQPTPGFLPGEFQGQRSLADCSPWDLRVGRNCAANTATLLLGIMLHWRLLWAVSCAHCAGPHIPVSYFIPRGSYPFIPFPYRALPPAFLEGRNCALALCYSSPQRPAHIRPLTIFGLDWVEIPTNNWLFSSQFLRCEVSL